MRASLLVLLAAALWGTTGTAQALAPASASSIAIGATRLIVGGLALLLVARKRGVLPQWRMWLTNDFVISAAAMAAYQPLFFTAVSQTGVAIGTIMAIGSAPIFVGLLGHFLRSEPLHPRWGIATTLSVAGVALITLQGRAIVIETQGIFLAVAAGASYGIYAVASKRLVATHDPDGVLAIVFGGAALLTAPVILATDLSWILEPAGAAAALHLGLIATALAYMLFSRGLASMPVSNAVTLTLAEPLTAALLGVLLLREQLTPASMGGAALVLIGLAILSIGTQLNRTHGFSGN